MKASNFLLLVFILVTFSSCQFRQPVVILIPEKPSSVEMLSAREIRRYIYHRTRVLPEIINGDKIPGKVKNLIVVANQESRLLLDIYPPIANLRDNLKNNGYSLKTVQKNGQKVLIVTGKDEMGILYGAYALAEKLGVRFYLHGDVIPDKIVRFSLPDLDERHNPLFELRGVQPFHDFPEGPDWWSLDDYKGLLAQLIKLKMNFIGFHTYPEGGVGPEPLVWIGLKEDINDDGTVDFSYPARHFTSVNGTWGYRAKKTDEYYFRTGELFEKSDYGNDYMDGMTPWPENLREKNELFNRTAKFFNEVFTYARTFEIKTCVGTETPMIIPEELKARLTKAGLSTGSLLTKTSLYEGMFQWIVKNYPIDFYWLWTPENWTWGGNKPEDIENTKDDILAAYKALKNNDNPFLLATCGWVLGPKQDRAMFDRILPEDISVSCINRNLGIEKIDSGFNNISGRSKWAIPWMEDDPGLTMPQLWVGRMRKDAHDAHAAGCNGLMGIHWHTREIGPNVSALAYSAWDGSDVSTKQIDKSLRDLPVKDFYSDWALANFGSEIAERAAEIFISLDGVYPEGDTSALFEPFMNRYVKMPRPADWINGPGAIKSDIIPWEKKQPQYSFVDKLESLRPMVNGKGNLDRFDYWLNYFKYLKAAGKLSCSLGDYNRRLTSIKTIKDKAEQKNAVVSQLLPLRKQIISEMEESHNYLISTITSKGSLGNLCNWQQHISDLIIEKPGEELEVLLGQKLGIQYFPGKEYTGKSRLIVPTVRTNLMAGEDLKLKIICFGFQPDKLVVKWKHFGEKSFMVKSAMHVSRGVYEVVIPSSEIKDDFEYFVSCTDKNGKTILWPANAGEINQSIVLN
ncbi:MAG: hypothetical protein MUO72_20710 [Bacteroidales bacterium]|nr:hypothetical protein [Bacteroidales bacterium]